MTLHDMINANIANCDCMISKTNTLIILILRMFRNKIILNRLNYKTTFLHSLTFFSSVLSLNVLLLVRI